MVLKDQLVTDAFAKLGLRLHTVGHSRAVDQGAFARGFAAGAHVDIHGGRANVAGRDTSPPRLSQGRS